MAGIDVGTVGFEILPKKEALVSGLAECDALIAAFESDHANTKIGFLVDQSGIADLNSQIENIAVDPIVLSADDSQVTQSLDEVSAGLDGLEASPIEISADTSEFEGNIATAEGVYEELQGELETPNTITVNDEDLKKVTADAKDAKQAVKEVGESSKSAGDEGTGSMLNLNGAMKQVGSFTTPAGLIGMVGAAAGVGVVATALYSAGARAADFEAIITDTAIRSGASYASLRSAIDSTGGSMQKAATAEQALADSGLKGEEITSKLKATLLLSKAAHLDVTAAADLQSKSYILFGSSASDATANANLFMAAQESGRASVEDLSSGLDAVAKSGAIYSSTLQEDTAALEMMASAGIPAMMAGRDLATIQNKLNQMNTEGAKLSDQEAAALGHMGVSASDLDPKLHSLSEITQTLRDHNMSAADATGLFGKGVDKAASSIVSGDKSLKDYTSSLTGTNSATEAANERNAEYGEKCSKLSSSLDNLTIKLGEYLVPALTTVADTLITAVSMVEMFGKGITDMGAAIMDGAKPAIDLLKKLIPDVFSPETIARLNKEAEKAGKEGGETFSTKTTATIVEHDPVSGALVQTHAQVVQASEDLGISAAEAFAKSNSDWISAHSNEFVQGYWDAVNNNTYRNNNGEVVGKTLDLGYTQVNGKDSLTAAQDLAKMNYTPTKADLIKMGYTVAQQHPVIPGHEVFSDEGSNIIISYNGKQVAAGNPSTINYASMAKKYTPNEYESFIQSKTPISYASSAATNPYISGINQPGLMSLLQDTSYFNTASTNPLVPGLQNATTKTYATPTEKDINEFQQAVHSFDKTTTQFNTDMKEKGADQTGLVLEQKSVQLDFSEKLNAFTDKYGADAAQQAIQAIGSGNLQLSAANMQLLAGVKITGAAGTTLEAANAFRSSTDYARDGLTTGAQVSAGFLTSAGNAVKIGLDASGRSVEVIGQVAQSNFIAAGGKFVSEAQAGSEAVKTNLVAGSQQASTIFSQSTQQSSKSWMDVLNQGDINHIGAMAYGSALGTDGAKSSAEITKTGAHDAATDFSGIVSESGNQFSSYISNLLGQRASNNLWDTGPAGYTGGGAAGSGGSYIGTSNGDNNFNDCLFEGFTDSCTGVLVNPLIYTNPSGVTSYINPMTYQDNGGIANYQGGASYGGGGGYGSGTNILGFADGGISDQAMLAKVSEGNQREIHLTEKNIEEFGLGPAKNTDLSAILAAIAGLKIYLDTGVLVGEVMTSAMATARNNGLSL